MFKKIKQLFYFPVAHYFRFWASIQLSFWKPRIIVITGSSGKTTTLHLLQSQLGDQVRYSHHANSAYGIPFDILGLKRETLKLYEWPSLFLLAPVKAFKKPFKEKIYVVEADCDRPGEGKFLSTLLNPEIVIWLSSTRTHSMNFDRLVHSGVFNTIDEAVAHEFGYFIENCTGVSILNGDVPNIVMQFPRTKSEILRISDIELEEYAVKNKTIFKTKNKEYIIRGLVPRGVFYSIVAIEKLTKLLNLNFDKDFRNFTTPPGRCSLFDGIKNTSLIDSTYNANLGSMNEIINLFTEISATDKWMVIGDMLEQGEREKEEHEKLARLIIKPNPKRVILLGTRVSNYTYFKLKELMSKEVILVKFERPKDVLDYLLLNIKGGETILFKGARFLEGVIENLLKNKDDAKRLSRREKVWQERRKKWGL